VAFWKQNLRSIRAHALDTFTERDTANVRASYTNERDAQMADNFIWLARDRFPGRKIIVWAATFHNIRNPETVGDSGQYVGLATMGHLSWKALGDEIYNLGFVASEGKAGMYRVEPRDIPKPVEGSIDKLLASTTHDLAIVDFRHLRESGAWLRNRMMSAPLGYSAEPADWTRVLDGIMYTRVMRPSTRATR
jgi:erythromycin esterase